MNPTIALAPAQSETRLSQAWLLLIIAHIPLALLLSAVTPLATLHAWATLGLGLYWALQRQSEKVTLATAYLIGAEVLWRATGAAVNWEFGKYALVLIFAVAILRSRKGSPPAVPFFYFALLVPGALMMIMSHPFDYARPRVSANISGPMALFLASWFFVRCVRLDRRLFVRIGLLWVAATLSLAVLGAQGLSAALGQGFEFVTASNDVAGGWTGANQSAAVFGLGAVACVFVLALGNLSRPGKGIVGLVLAFLVVQNALTFSRTGLALTLIGALAFGFFLIRESRYRLTLLFSVIILAVLVQTVMVPALNSLTGGTFVERYTDTDLTQRDTIMLLDLEIWWDHVFFGVGAGGAPNVRERYGYRDAAAHTEYTRLLAEHGMLGMGSLILFLVMCAQPIFRARTPEEKGVVLALVFWASAFMIVSSFRLSIPAFLIGLSWAQFAFHSTVAPLTDRGHALIKPGRLPAARPQRPPYGLPGYPAS
ncbi:MAG: O-antigen ligase family protein [Bacteroidota bacterium]